jgi:hypothetical protein
MLLASNKLHKEITKNRKTKQKRTAEKNNKDQVGLQEALHLKDFIQNHAEYSKC